MWDCVKDQSHGRLWSLAVGIYLIRSPRSRTGSQGLTLRFPLPSLGIPVIINLCALSSLIIYFDPLIPVGPDIIWTSRKISTFGSCMHVVLVISTALQILHESLNLATAHSGSMHLALSLPIAQAIKWGRHRA